MASLHSNHPALTARQASADQLLYRALAVDCGVNGCASGLNCGQGSAIGLVFRGGVRNIASGTPVQKADVMTKMLDGQTIIVTGAGRGIGREIALMAAQHGAKVLVNDLGGSAEGEGGDRTVAEQVVEEIKQAGGQAIANGDSVSDPEGCERMLKSAVQAFGRIDGVVNNAGILRDRIFHRMSVVDWDAVIKVHLYGTFYMSKAAAPYFKEQNCGAFVHFTSTSGLIGNLGQANYSAAKMGIVGLSKSIALDMAKFGVRSNCVSPFAWSRLIGTIPVDTPEQKARVERIQNTMTAAKIAPLCVFLLSQRAAEVSGQIFAVRKDEICLMSQPRPIRSAHKDGGWTPDAIADSMLPAFKSAFYPLDASADVFNCEPL
jgi:NAD(P)-dependent dehydrogenase (short-subunit alcohol dehydrogenase family)